MLGPILRIEVAQHTHTQLQDSFVDAVLTLVHCYLWLLASQRSTTCHTPALVHMIEHGLTSAPTQYRLYGRRFFTGQKTQPTVSKYWRRKLQRKTSKTQRKQKIHICI